MKKNIKLAICLLILATMTLKAQTSFNLCTGSSTVITAVNSAGLSNPSYSMNPGGITSSGPSFTVSPVSDITYTLYVTGSNSSSAVVTTSNIVAISMYGVAYTISSPTSFTLGCNSQSVCIIAINATTTPLAGGAVVYALLPPGSSTSQPITFSYSVPGITYPGAWTAVIRDPANLCTYWDTLMISASTNTPPTIGTINVSQHTITCSSPSATLYPNSSSALQFAWSYPAPSGIVTVANPTLVVSSGTNLAAYIALQPTLVATDINTGCQSSTVVTIYQNAFAPAASISSGSAVCAHTVQLTNTSSTGIPPASGFSTSAPVVAVLWEAPAPQPTLGSSSTYAAQSAGIYSMTAMDLNNGCTVTATIQLGDGLFQPVAAFVHTVTGGVAVFNDVSTGTNSTTTYFWDFGDGVSSVSQNPTHTYSSGGAHLVKFKVTKNGSCSDSIIQSVNVVGIPCVANSNFSMVPTSTAQVWNVVPAYPWNVLSATWDWGDGSSSNTLYTSHQYATAGMYNICLSVTVSCVASSSTCTTYSVYRTSQAAMMLKINVVAPDLVLGLASQQADEQPLWSIVPNPNAGEFQISLDHIRSASARMIITDLTGRVVHEQMVDPDSGAVPVHSEHLPAGMYFVSLETDQLKLTKRMVVDH